MTTVEGKTVGRAASHVLTESRDLIDSALRAAIDGLPASMRRVAGYHFGWWDEHGTPAVADSGKAIRPALVLLAAEAAGGDASSAVPAAVAVELVHNFSLLHDDVMDGDATRRRRPTAWSVFGISSAILAGDALLTVALDTLAASGHSRSQEGMRMLSAAVLGLVDGQSADMSFEEREDVNLPECLTMARGKTGALLACACAVGALFADGDPVQVASLRAFGEHLGLAFQHVDDLLGIWGDPAATGKPIYSDLNNRKKSLPVVAALNSGDPAARELAELYHRTQPLSETELVRTAELVDICGGRVWSQQQADELLARALDALAVTELAPRPTAELGALARLVTRRDH